jgi:hypothetical protein
VNPVRRSLLAGSLFALGALLGGLGVWAVRVPAAPPTGLEATVYLPLVDNQGKPFSDAELQEALGLLVDRFGGATVGERAEGYWRDANQRVHREPVRRVTVVFPRDRLDEFRDALRQLGRRLGQETIYLRLDEARVEFLTVAPTKAEKER